MKNLIFLIVFFSLNLFSDNLNDIFDKKITLEDGIYDLGAIAKILENNLGLETRIVINKKFTLVTNNFKERKLRDLILDILILGVEMKFLLDGKNIILQLSSPLKSIEEKTIENNHRIDLAFKNVDLKTIAEALKNMIGVEFIFEKEKKENLKVDCNLKAITIDEFLSFLKENYKIEYEKKGNIIYIK